MLDFATKTILSSALKRRGFQAKRSRSAAGAEGKNPLFYLISVVILNAKKKCWADGLRYYWNTYGSGHRIWQYS